MKKFISIFILFISIGLVGKAQVGGMLAYDIEIFEKTKVWELAKAVKHQNINKIKELCEKNPKWVNYQERRFGFTVLHWALFNQKYKSVKPLLESGANPNLQDSDGVSSLCFAADIEETSEYLQLTLKYGGNVNSVSKKPGGSGLYGPTPLCCAANRSLENTKILVEAGANVNYFSIHCENVFNSACSQGKFDILRYLIVEKGANFKRAICYRTNGDSLYITDELRRLKCDLGSKKFLTKMEIVEYMKERGMDYWAAPQGSQYYDVMDEEREYLKTHKHR